MNTSGGTTWAWLQQTIIVALGSWKEIAGEALLNNKRLQCILECKREKKKDILMHLKVQAQKEVNSGTGEQWGLQCTLKYKPKKRSIWGDGWALRKTFVSFIIILI